MSQEIIGVFEMILRRYREAVFICVDPATAVTKTLCDEFGEQFIDVGISEQNALAVAAGIASEGAIPIVYSLAGFLTRRGLDQIYSFFEVSGLTAIIVGAASGSALENLGRTHLCRNDLATLSGFPNVELLSPIDHQNFAGMMEQLVCRRATAYVRLEAGLENCLPVATDLFRDWYKVKSGERRALLTFGASWQSVDLGSLDEDVAVYCFCSMSQASRSQISKIVLRYDSVDVVEDHVEIGGLASLCTIIKSHKGRTA